MPNNNAPGSNRNFLGEISRMYPVLYGNFKYQQQYIIFPESWNKALPGLEYRPSIGRQQLLDTAKNIYGVYATETRLSKSGLYMCHWEVERISIEVNISKLFIQLNKHTKSFHYNILQQLEKSNLFKHRLLDDGKE